MGVIGLRTGFGHRAEKERVDREKASGKPKQVSMKTKVQTVAFLKLLECEDAGYGCYRKIRNMYRKRRRSNYKFTEKKQSKRGIGAFGIALISIGIFVSVVWNSYLHEGAGSMYLGSAGVASMLLSMVAFVLAVMSMREEDSFKLFPYLGLIFSFLALGTWIGLYVAGTMLV